MRLLPRWRRTRAIPEPDAAAAVARERGPAADHGIEL